MKNDNLPDNSEDTDACTQVLDACGLHCPLPLLKAKQALARMQAGECLKVLATDAGSVRDFRSYAAISGHRLRRFRTYDDIYEYILEKASDA